MNKNKNRFAFFKDLEVDEAKNYKCENFFEKLVLIENKIDNNSIFRPIGAKERIYNQLSYKLGKSMIENSKNLKDIIKMPFVLLK
ncbi:TPA: sugar transferase, partial [Campylobacter jejuni]|nr:sugar transferase [Campylobacter jejuni]